MERLLTLAREQLGAEVVYLDPVPVPGPAPEPASAPVAGSGADEVVVVDVPVTLPDGRDGGALRFTRRSTSGGQDGEDDADEEVLKALAALLAAHMATPGFAQHAWRERLVSIRGLLDGGTLPVLYQPIADLRSGDIVGVEALARFPGGPMPQRWFNEATSVGLGIALEALAIRRAVQILPDLAPSLYLSLNVSPEAAMSWELREALAGVPLHRVVLEITEHAQVGDYEGFNASIKWLRARGVRLAVDDAGSGFASLRHVLRMSPDIIKLDISLTQGIDNDSVLRALGYSLSAFASAIDADVVAEGVETEREVHALRFLQVRYGQGFYLCRPTAPPFPERLDGRVFERPTSRRLDI